MGRTFRTHNNGERFTKAKDLKEAVLDMDFRGHKIACIALRNFGNEAYVVFEGNDGNNHMAVVKIFNRVDDFGTKVITEDMGPFYYDAPKYMLEHLSPTDNAESIGWRKLAFQTENVKQIAS
jgi:hypothetical protein